MKAFPMRYSDGTARNEGMDLKDYFAAKAMQALITRWGSTGFNTNEMAKSAYEMADAMMKAREK
jgi:hypothetical protein